MPANQVQFGDGMLLEVNDGVAGTFVAVTEIEQITPPGHSRRMVERRRLSVNNLVERVASPRRDPGDLQFTFEMTDVLQARLDALDGVSRSYRVTYPDGLRLAFTGTLYSLKPQAAQAEGFTMGQAIVACQSLIAITDTTP